MYQSYIACWSLVHSALLEFVQLNVVVHIVHTRNRGSAYHVIIVEQYMYYYNKDFI